MITVKSPVRVALNKLYPASIYARPALAPLVVGVGGQTGKAQQQLTEMYKYTIKQMAISPFAVNSEEYMKRIREEYGYVDDGTYDAMGTVGAVVGAGMGALIGSGVPASLIKDGTPKLISKRYATSQAFQRRNINKFINENTDLVNTYNKALDVNKNNINKLTKHIKSNDLQELYRNESMLKLLEKDPIKNAEKIKELNETISTLRQSANDETLKTFDSLKSSVENSSKALSNSIDDIAQSSSKYTDDVLEIASKGKSVTKFANTAMGVAGTVMDVASLGLNIAGAVQAFEDGSVLDSILYSVGAVGDAASIAGDVITYIPGVGTVVGTALNWIGALVSMGAGALIGMKVGETVGHSLSPEGAKAQQLFAENLYGSMFTRPLTTVATVLTSTIAVPVALNALSSSKNKVISAIGNTLVHNAWGNYIRSATTMMATQGINALTTKVEDAWIPPQNAEDVNFVTAFSVVGDLNDNLFGATARKATLLGLAKGDPHAQTEALAKAWGYSNEDIYYNPTFDDIRQAVGIDLGNIGNSILGIVGEVLIDPQNLSEIADKLSTDRMVNAGTSSGVKSLSVLRAKFVAGESIDINDPALRLIFDMTEDGHQLKTLMFNSETNKYELPTELNKDLQKVQIYKDGDTYKQLFVEDNKVKSKIISNDVQDLYNKVDYDMTHLGSLSETNLRKILRDYYTHYLNKGKDGVRDVYISRQVQRLSGSKYVAENASDLLFVDNMTKFIEDTFKKETNLDIVSIKNNMTQTLKNNPDEFKNKFASLYKYYNIKNEDADALIAKVISDFDLKLKTNDIVNLYATHEGFHNQMDLIQNVTDTVNKIANPVLTGVTHFKKFFIDWLNTTRSITNTKYRADLVVKLEDIGTKYKGFTREDIDNAKEELKAANEYIRKEITEEALKEEISKNTAATQEINNAVHTQKRVQDIVDDINESLKEIKKHSQEKRLNDYTIKDVDNREVIHVSESNIKEIYDEIKSLNEKPHLNYREKKRLDALTNAYISYKWNNQLTQVHVKYLQDTANLFLMLDELTQNTSKIFTDLLVTFNKFKLLTASENVTAEDLGKNLETINKHFALLGIDSKFTIDDKGTVKISKDGKPVSRKDPTKNKNLRMYYDVDLSEYLCTLFNGKLAQRFGEQSTGSINVTEVFAIKTALGKIDFETWKDLTDEEKLNTLTAVLTAITSKDGASSFRSYLLANPKILTDIIRNVNNAANNTTKGSFRISKPLADVDLAFIKRTVMSQIMKKKETAGYAKLIKNIIDKLDSIETYLNETKEVLNAAQFEDIKLFKKQLSHNLNYALKDNVMYDLLNEYIFIGNFQNKILSLSPQSKGLVEVLSKQELEKLNSGKMSLEETKAAHQRVATSKVITELKDIFKSSEYMEEINELSVSKGITNTDETEATSTNGLLDADAIGEEPIVYTKDELLQHISDETISLFVLDHEDILTTKFSDIKKLVTDWNTKNNTNLKDSDVVKELKQYKRTKTTRYLEEQARKQVDEEHKKYTEYVRKGVPYNLDNKPSQTVKAEYDLARRSTKSTERITKIEAIDTLLNTGIFSKNIIDTDGYLRIKITPTHFSDGKKSLPFREFIGDTDNKVGVELLPGYKSEVETFINNIIELVKSSKGSLQIEYRNKKYGINNIDSIKDDLVAAYMKYKSTYKGINLLYNSISKHGNNKQYETATYYKKLLHNAVIVKLNRDFYNGKIPQIPGINYIDAKQYIKELKKYIQTLDSTSDTYKELNKYIDELYKESKATAEKKLTYDTNLKINKSLNPALNNLFKFETDTIKSRNVNNPKLAEDIAKKSMIKDPYYRKMLQDLRDGKDETTFIKFINFLENYITETTSSFHKFKVIDFTGITQEDDVYYFTHANGFKVSLIELMFEYHITREQMYSLLNHVSKGLPEDKVTHIHTQVNNIYTELSEMFIKQTSKEEFVSLISSKLDPNDKAYTDEIKKAEDAYDTLYNDWEARKLVTELTYNHRKTYTNNMLQISDFKELYNPITLYLVNRANNYYKTNYKYTNGVECKTLNDYFLMEIISWVPKTEDEKSLKRKYLEEIFFPDFKTAQNIFSESYIKKLEARRDIWQACANEDSNNPYFKIQINSLNQRIKYCKDNKLADSENKKTWIDTVLNMSSNDPKIKTVLEVFSNTRKISDTDTYIPVRLNMGKDPITGEDKYEYVLTTVAATEGLVKETKGAGPLNIYIASRFYDKLKDIKDGNKTLPEEFIWNDGFGNVLIVKNPKEDIKKEAKDIKYEYEQSHKDTKHIYVLDPKQFKEFQDMFNKEELVSFSVTTEEFTPEIKEQIEKGTIDTWEVPFIENRINVKSKVTVSAFIEDLQNINKYLGKEPKNLTESDLEHLYKYVDTFNKYPMLLKSYLSNVSLKQSDMFKNLVKDAETTEAFFEFMEFFKDENGEIKINLAYIADYFTDAYIKQDKEVATDTTQWYTLKNKQINGRAASDILLEALTYMRSKYKTSKVDLKYTNVLNANMNDKLFRLKNLMNVFLRQAKTASHQGSKLKQAFNKMYDQDLYDLNAKLIDDEQAYNESKWIEYTKDTKTFKEVMDNLELDYIRNHNNITNNYISRKQAMNNEKYNLKESNLNFKTTYTIIKAIEECKGNLFTIDEPFEIVYSNDTIKFLLETQDTYNLIKQLKDMGLSSNEINEFVYNEIVFPFIQNIAVEFKTSNVDKMMENYYKQPSEKTDVRYGALFNGALYIKEQKLYEQSQTIINNLAQGKLDNEYMKYINDLLDKCVSKNLIDTQLKQEIYNRIEMEFKNYLDIFKYASGNKLSPVQLDNLFGGYPYTLIENTVKSNNPNATEDDIYKAYLQINIKYLMDLLEEYTVDVDLLLMIQSSPKILKELEDFAKEKGIDYTKQKQKTKITKDDFNKYSYKSNDLEKSHFIMYETGYNRSEQQADTISNIAVKHDSIKDKNLDKSFIDKFLDSISRNFTKSIKYEIRDINKDTQRVDYLKQNNILTIHDLEKHFYNKSNLKDKLSLEQYILGLRAYRAYNEKLRKHITTKDMSVGQEQYNDAANMFLNSISGTDQERVDLMMQIYSEGSIINKYRKQLYSSEQTLQSFKNDYDMVHSINSNICNLSQNFMSWLKISFEDTLEQMYPGNKSKEVYKRKNFKELFNIDSASAKTIERIFKESNNLHEFYNKLINTHTIKDKQTIMYKLLVTINHYKDLYKNTITSRKWSDAIKYVETNELAKNVKDLQSLDLIMGQGPDDGMHVFSEINRPLKSLSSTLRTIQSINNDLSRLVIDDVPSYVKALDEDIVVFRENKFTTALRQLQAQSTRVLFKDQNEVSLGVDAAGKLNREFQAENLDMMQELSAKKLEQCMTINPTFHGIRTLFTDLLKLIKTDFKEHEFIRVQDVAAALRSFESKPLNKSFYAGQYDVFVKDIQDFNEVNNAINDINKFFEKDYLIDIDTYTVKAIMGYMFYHMYCKSSDSVKHATFTKYMKNKAYDYTTIEHRLNDDVTRKIYTICHATNESKPERMLELSKLIYKTSTPTKAQEERLNMMLSIADKHSTIESTDWEFWDTFDTVITEQLEPAQFEQYAAERNVIKVVREKLNTNEQKLKDINRSINIKSSSVRKLKTVKDGEIIDTEFHIKDGDTIVEQYLNDANTDLNNEIIEYEKILNNKYIEIEKDRNIEILNFIESDVIFNILSKHGTDYNKYMEETIDPIKASIDKDKNYLTNSYKIFDEDMIDKYIQAKLYIHSNQLKYNIIKQYRRNLTDTLALDIIKLEYTENNIDVNTLEADIKEFEEHMASLNAVEKAISNAQYTSETNKKINNKLDALTDNIRNIYNLEQTLEYYNNIDWKNIAVRDEQSIKIKDEQAFKYASKIFYMFIDDINKSKRTIAKRAYEQFKENLKSGKETITTQEIKDRTETTLNNQTKKVLSGIQATYNNSCELPIMKSSTKTTIVEKTNDGVRIIHDEANTRAELDRISKELANAKESLETSIKESEESMNMLPGQKHTINKDELKEILKDEYLKDIDSKNAIDIFNEIVYKSIKEQKPLSEYIKQTSTLAEYLYSKRKKYLYEIYLKRINNSIDIVNTHIQEYIDYMNQSKNLTNVLIEIPGKDDTRIVELKQQLITKYGEDVVNNNEQYINEAISKPFTYNLKQNPAYKEIKDRITILKEAKEHNQSNLNDIDSYRKALETKEDLEAKRIEIEKEYNDKLIELKEIYQRVHNIKTNTSNSKLYNTYFNSTDAVGNVQERLKKDGIFIDESVFTEAGDVSLHNPVVDCTITMYNYMHQKGWIDTITKVVDGKTITEKIVNKDKVKRFVVFDMETVKDITNTNKPYQMTIIEVTVENGVIKATPVTVYCNSYVFMDGTIENPGVLLKQFIEQQGDIYKKEEPNISQEEINRRVQKIIDTVSNRKNTLAKTAYLLDAITLRKVPIVAHNGKKFDFVNFDKFIKDSTSHIIRDEYFEYNLSYNKDDIQNKINSLNLDKLKASDKFKTELQMKIHELEKLYRSGEIFSQSALLKLETTLHQITVELSDIAVRDAVANAYQKLHGTTSNINLFEDQNDEFDKIRKAFLEYYTEKDINKKQLILTNIQSEFPDKYEVVKTLFENTEKTLQENKAKEDSIFTKAVKSIIEQYKLESKYTDNYNHELRMASMLAEIESYTNMINHLQELGESDPNNKTVVYEEFLQKQKEITQQLDKVNEEIIQLDNQIEELNKQRIVQEEFSKKAYSKIYDAMVAIRNKTLYSIREAKMVLHRDLDTYIANKNISNFNKNELEYNIHRAELDISNLYNTLITLVKAFDSIKDSNGIFLKPEDLEDLAKNLDQRLSTVRTTEDSTKLLNYYTTREQEVNKLLEDLSQTSTIWEECWKDLKRSAENTVKQYKKNLILVLNNIKAKGFETFVDEILLKVEAINTKKDLYDIRDTILNYRNTNSDFKTFMLSDDLSNNLKLYIAQEGTFSKYLDIYSTTDTPAFSQNNKNIARQLLLEEQTMLANSILVLKAMNMSNDKVVYDDIVYYIQKLLENCGYSEEAVNKTLVETAERAMFRNVTGSIYKGDIDDETMYEEFLKDFTLAASSVIDKTDAIYKLDPSIKRHWKNAREGNDILALTIDPKVAVYDENENSIRISFNTDYYNNLQTLVIPKDEKGKIKDQSAWRFEFTYMYNQKGQDLDNPKINKNLKYTMKEFKELINANKLFTNDGIYKKIMPYEYMVFENSTDTNRQSISRLINYFNNLSSSKNYEKFIKENTVYKNNLNITNLIPINLSDRVRTKFAQHIMLHNIAQSTDFKLPNNAGLYTEIFKRVMGNLNALKYGQYLMRMPEGYDNDSILKILDKGIEDLNIETLKATEASMGFSFSIKDEYSVQPMFSANTNTVRSILTSNVLYGTFTTIGVNNDIFERFDNDTDNESKTLEDYIYNLEDGKDKERFEKWCDKKIEEEVANSKNKSEESIKRFIKQRKKELTEQEKLRYSLLKKGNLSIFTPRVAQSNTLKKYDQDVLHPLGVNLTVAYTSDNRAFEDDFLIDAKYARALGWNESNKTWTKYGFKGAVKFIEGLHDMYGAVIVGKAPSVQDRGSYGAYLEMAYNVILDYKLGLKVSDKAKDILDKSDFVRDIKVFNTWKEADADTNKGLIYIVNNKIITDKDDKIDYALFLNNLIQNKVDLNNKAVFKDNKNGDIEFVEMLKAKVKDGSSYQIKDTKSDEMRTITYDKESTINKDGTVNILDEDGKVIGTRKANNEFFRGTLYVLMDAEHTASHMQTNAQLKNKTDSELAYISKDVTGSVEKGGMWSFTVEQSAAQKIGFEWINGIIGADTDNTTQDLAQITLDIIYNGAKAFTPIVKENKIDIEATIENILIEHKLSDAYKPYLKEYYYALQQNKLNPNDPIWQDRLEIAEVRLQNHALDTYKGPKGLGYRSRFRRFWAARNQLLANTSLATGEIKFPANAFNNLAANDKDNQWRTTESKEPITQNKVNELLIQYAKDYNKEEITLDVIKNNQKEYYAELYKRLRYLGFLDDNFEIKGKFTEEVQGAEVTTYIDSLKLKADTLTQTVAYVIAIRSPVQDYAATPVLKITGVTEHAAVEGNAAMYAIMGADNDGDTAAFIAVKSDEVKDGCLKNLDAFNKSEVSDYADGYYDKGYLQSLRGDLGIKQKDNIADNAINYYKHASTKYAYIGKKTSSSTKYTMRLIDEKNRTGILYCDSKGDKRYSALYAKVTINGITDTIENFYQKCKRDKNGKIPGKGKPVDHIILNGTKHPASKLSEYYEELWRLYFKENPDLLEEASNYKEFKDRFKGKSINSQENVISKLVEEYLNPIKELNKLSVIRKGDTHYTYTEMIASASMDLFKKIQNKVSSKNIKLGKLTGAEENEMFWIESHIWINSNKQTIPSEKRKDGSEYTKNFYKDADQIKEYYDKHKEEIQQLKLIEYYLNNTPEGMQFVEEHLEDMIKAANYATLVRGHVSKVNIGVTGGLRKDVNLGTLLSIFPNMNRTISTSDEDELIEAQNKLWNEQYGINDIENLTVEKLATTLFSDIFTWDLNKLKQLRDNPNSFNCKYKDSLDYEIIAKTMAEVVIEYKLIEKGLPKLIDLVKTNTPTYKHVYELLDSEAEYLLEPMKSLYNKLKDNPELLVTKVNDVVLGMVKTYYLSRFVNDFESNIRDTNTKEVVVKYLNNFKNQYILTRIISKRLNDVIQQPISLSKHGSSLGDYTLVHEELGNNAKEMAKKYAINKVFFGDSLHHARAITMGNEYDLYERKDIRFEVSDKLKNKRKTNSKDNNILQQLNKQSLQTSLDRSLIAIVKYDICGGFISDKEVSKFIEHFEIFTKTLSDNLSKRHSNVLDIQEMFSNNKQAIELIKAIKFFEHYNVSIYRLIQGAYHMLNKIKEAKSYDEDITPSQFKRLVGITNLKGINKKLIQEQYKNANNAIQYFVNYITEKDNPISDSIIINEELSFGDEDTIVYNPFDTYEYTDKDLWLAASEQLSINEYRFPDDIKENKTLDNLINQIGVRNLETKTTKDQLIKDIISDIFKLDNVRRNQIDIIKNNKRKETTSNVIQQIINDNVTDYKFIRPHTEEAAKYYKELSDINKELESIRKKKESTESKKLELELSKNKLLNLQDSTKELDPGNTIKLLKAERNKLQDKYNKSLEQSIKFAMLSSGLSDVLYLIQRDSTPTNLKILNKEDIKKFNNQLIVNMDNYQHPFHILVNSFRTGLNNNDIDWNKLYKYIKTHYSELRITQVIKANNNEGLARQLFDFIKVKDTAKYKDNKTWNELSRKEKKKYLEQHNKKVKVESFEDLQNLTKNSVQDIKYILKNKKMYDAIGDDVVLSDFITPTLKQIKIRNVEDLKKIWELITTQGDKAPSIGFTYLNEILSATEDAYKPYKLAGKAGYIAAGFNMAQKALMRMSSGFLLRNAMDTFNQLISDMYLEQGISGIALNSKQIVKYLLYGESIYNNYKRISEERMFTLSEILLANNNINKNINLDDNLKVLKRYLETYYLQGKALVSSSYRINERLKTAEELYKRLETTTGYTHKKLLANQITTFLTNIKFTEYLEFFDTKIINGKPVLGLRIDADADDKRKNAEKVSKTLYNKDDLYKSLLVEVSAYMQTNAQVDIFKQKNYKEMYDMVNQTKYELTHNTRDKTIKEIEKEIEYIRDEANKDIGAWITNKPLSLYTHITERTENIARILGFIYCRELYGKTFDDSVQTSLKMWFNYGQRSPLEMQLTYDIPYISFPIRSISNWSSRLLNPKYARLMDDIIDGVYSQYADEDGQYSEYEQFMIQNGWIPITNNLGIRAGSGAFDIVNLLKDPAEQIKQRSNPILRGLSELVYGSHDIVQAAKQLATVGKINQAAQFVTAGAYNASKGTWSEPSIGKMFTATFEYNDYEKYTPKQYSYLYNNNGRAKYYENIYRDWFTKYGRMRKPTQDPVQLVKGIQWKQFLKKMQNKYRR